MSNDLVIVKLSRCKELLFQCHTAEQAKQISDLAQAAGIYAKRQKMGIEVVNQAVEYKLRAERRLGEILAKSTKNVGSKGQLSGATRRVVPATTKLSDIGISHKLSSRSQQLARVDAKTFESVLTAAKESSQELTTSMMVRETVRSEVKARNQNLSSRPVRPADGTYDVIVIDPPWPMQKVDRDCRPNQAGLDYPTMSIEEIKKIKIPHSKGTHIWLWTTHKFLPNAFEVLASWNARYVCTFVWEKPGGPQPFELPQYINEFVLYARIGKPNSFVTTKKFNTRIEGKRRAHSEKPEEFYELLRRVTDGSRLDMFNRREIEGFDRWGNEATMGN